MATSQYNFCNNIPVQVYQRLFTGKVEQSLKNKKQTTWTQFI